MGGRIASVVAGLAIASPRSRRRAAGTVGTTKTVPRPLSKSSLERLGRQLVASDQPERADVEQLHILLAAYGPVLTDAVDLVSREVGVFPSSRIKTTGTLLEKLRRNGSYTLSSIHDLAGMRVVVQGGRLEQDELAERIRLIFAGGSREARLLDRRLRPMQGYRAVHVIVYPHGFPIEVQVRTYWQHVWAELFERLADQYGRGIRYGEPPATGGEVAQNVVAWMIQLSDQIAEAEEADAPQSLSAVALALMTTGLGWLDPRRPGE
jgi:hypothetical protein